MTFAARFARGRKAKAQCPRCGLVMPYKRLRRDGYKKDLWVCPDCFDPEHPQEKIKPASDPVALHHPQPLQDTGTTASVTSLASSLDGGTTFGGGT